VIHRLRRLSSLALLATAAWSLALPPVAAAHEGVEVGHFVLTIGWRNEPALVSQPNGIQVFVADHDSGDPINTGVDLAVVVSTAGQSTDTIALTPQFVVGEYGTPGEYGAEMIPTSPGDYTFALTGSIRDTDVDVDVTSGEDTFSPILGSSDLEFPVKLPSTGEIVTRLDRIDGRIEALQSAAPGQDVGEAIAAANAAASTATEAARSATSAANQALLVGAGLGVAGVLIGLVAVAMALRAGRRGSAAA
jgi:hypothetical protein